MEMFAFLRVAKQSLYSGPLFGDHYIQAAFLCDALRAEEPREHGLARGVSSAAAGAVQPAAGLAHGRLGISRTTLWRMIRPR